MAYTLCVAVCVSLDKQDVSWLAPHEIKEKVVHKSCHSMEFNCAELVLFLVSCMLTHCRGLLGQVIQQSHR